MNHDLHPTWCAQGHHCAIHLGEHRARPITVAIPGAGSLVLTRVRTSNGRDHAEIRLSIALATDERGARQQLAALLTHLRTLIGPARTSVTKSGK